MSVEIQDPQAELQPEPQAEEQAAETKQMPAIAIGFDAETQRAVVHFDNKVFKTWDFVLAVIEMGRLTAEHMKAEAIEASRMQQMQLMAQNAQVEAEVQEMKQKLMGHA